MFFMRALVCCLVLLAGLRAEDVRHYRLLGSAPALEETWPGLRLVVYSASRARDSLTLRLGLFNSGPQPFRGSWKLREDAVFLRAETGFQVLAPVRISENLREPALATALPPGTAWVGELEFAVPGDAAETAWKLQVPGFPPLEIQCAEPQRYHPPADQTAAPVPPKTAAVPAGPPLADVPGLNGALQLIRLQLAPMAWEKDRLICPVTLRNPTRQSLRLDRAALRERVLLITREGQALAVLPEPADAPRDIPGDGTLALALSFPLPHRLARDELGLFVPGFPPLRLRWGEATGQYRAEAGPSAAGPASPSQPEPEPALAEERVFLSLKAYWATLTAHLQKKEYNEALAIMAETGTARGDLMRLMDGLSSAPVSSIDFELERRQRLPAEPGAVLRGVTVHFKYTLATISRDNVFYAKLKCDLEPGPEGSWRLGNINYGEQPPFWILGYNAVRNTKHFLLFYKPDSLSMKRLSETAMQVETAWQTLKTAGLPMEEHSVVFLIPGKEDFKALTNRDADTFSGAASCLYREQDGKIVSVNRAMYVNDYRFLALQKELGMKDRQTTITHELAHLALAADTRPFTPPWLVEGLAMHYAGQTGRLYRALLARSGALAKLSLVQLTALAHLGEGTADAATVNARYYLSSEAVRLLVEMHGIEKVLQLYRSYGERSAEDLKRTLLTLGTKPMPNDPNQFHPGELCLQLTMEALPKFAGGLSLLALDQRIKELSANTKTR